MDMFGAQGQARVGGPVESKISSAEIDQKREIIIIHHTCIIVD
jgi:hypothetical protein